MRNEESGGESAICRQERGGTGVTQTITWLFLAAGARPFIFHVPAVAVCGDAFLDSRAHMEYIHPFGFEPQW